MTTPSSSVTSEVWGPLAPRVDQRLQRELGDEDADDRLAVAHRRGGEVAGLAGGRADGEEARLAPLDRAAEVGPEAVVRADEARRLAPVARGDRPAPAVHQVDDGGRAPRPCALEQPIDLPGRRAGVGAEGIDDARVVGEQSGHERELFELAVELGDLHAHDARLATLGPPVLEPSGEQHQRDERRRDERERHERRDGSARRSPRHAPRYRGIGLRPAGHGTARNGRGRRAQRTRSNSSRAMICGVSLGP